jgi:hypothetical protein
LHRKHAMRLLRGTDKQPPSTRRPDRLLLFCGKPPTASVASD